MSTGMSMPLSSIPQMPSGDELKQLAKRVAVVEKYVKQQPANAELIMQRQNDTDAVINKLIKQMEELRLNLSQMMDYFTTFSKTVMGLLEKK